MKVTNIEGGERTSILVQRFGRELDVPGRALDGVSHRRLDIAEESQRRVGLVINSKGDGVVLQVSDLPHAVGPVVGAAVQRVVAVVLLRVDGLAVERVGAVADAVGVPARSRVVHRVSGVLGWGGC